MKQLDFDLSKTVGDCAELVRPLADERDVTFAAIECVGDSERLTQVVTNLLPNAIQYNQPINSFSFPKTVSNPWLSVSVRG